jgi:alkanesulfonate monooxygenase SsuD/methylene tetrahydromethanopterin reductase-like flavin-dependent oxidoreductase (luciferase family)
MSRSPLAPALAIGRTSCRRERTDTQLVGSPKAVADKLEQLRDATGAYELAVTTITHDHADRVRSYQLLAEEWTRRGNR